MADDGVVRTWGPGEDTYCPKVGRAICARVAAGESLTRLCREPKMPCRNTVRTWSHKYPEFGGALLAAMKAQRTAQRLRDRAKWQAHEKKLLPGTRRSTYRPEIGEAICERLAHGESLTSIGRDPAMPSYGTILRWAQRHEDFDEMYVEARKLQADYFFDEVRDIAVSAEPGNVWVARLRFDIARWMTARMRPHKYCERLVVDAAIAERKAEEDPERQGLTVIVKRFSDVTPEEEEAARLTEEGYFDRPQGRR
jgi:hypothetical protein